MNANQILQSYGTVVRGSFRISEQITRRVGSGAFGLARRVRHIRPSAKPEMDDVTLARKVEAEIFRGTRAPKPKVNVNVVDGVVWLRGEVKRPQQIRNLERKALSVPEVRGIENLLHLAKTPAATRADAPRRQQRTRSSTRRPTPRRTRGRVTDDKTTALVSGGEPSPAEHAEHGQGRSPAPFGATEEPTPAPSSEESTPAPSHAIEEPTPTPTSEEPAPAPSHVDERTTHAAVGAGEADGDLGDTPTG